MKSLSAPTLLAALMLLAPLAALTAQSPTPLSPGARVRVTVQSIPTTEGTVVESSDRSFRFVRDKSSDTITVEYASVTRLEVSVGRRHRILHHAALGAVAGFVVGGIIGAARHPNFPNTYKSSDPGGCSAVNPHCVTDSGDPSGDPTGADAKRTAKGAAIGAAAGFVVGMALGKILESEVWRTVPAEKYHVHVAMTPVPGGVGLRFTMAM